MFFMVAVAACMINLVGKAGSTQDCEELQSGRSVECGTCQTVRKRMRLHLSTWLNLMSSTLWGTPLPHRGPGWCVRWEHGKMVSGDLTMSDFWINNLAKGIGQSQMFFFEQFRNKSLPLPPFCPSCLCCFRCLSGHGNLRLRFEETLPDGLGARWNRQRFGDWRALIQSALADSTKDVSLTPLHINTLLYNLLVGMKCLVWKLPGLWVRAKLQAAMMDLDEPEQIATEVSCIFMLFQIHSRSSAQYSQD